MMIIQLQVFDPIMKFRVNMIEKIQDLFDVYYQL